MKDMLQGLVYGGLFLVLFLPLLVTDSLFFPFITGKNFFFRIIVEIVFSAWILLALIDARYRPKFSWILVTFTVFIALISLSAVLGKSPATSFWSNYERMDGIVTIIHLWMYFVVLGSMAFTARTWSIFLHTTIAVAAFVAVKGYIQMQNSGIARIDSTLGNSAYMAVYMLFHIFFTALLYVRAKDWWYRGAYILISLLFLATLLQTGTRGTFLGLAGGAVVSVAYVAIFGARFPQFRKLAIGGIIALVVLAGTLYSVREADFIQSNGSLARIANIDLKSDLVVRGTIWGMALDGVKERPVLGWGHGNFNFVFNQNYKAELYNQEQWFDRTHNIFLDWLIAGGVVGFLSYFSIMGAILYYLFWIPLRRKEVDTDFNVLERAIILGLLTGYLLHNVVVFDNIISYIFYGTLLGLVHARVARTLPKVEKFKVSQTLVLQVATPVVLVLCVAGVYFVNIPSYLAAGDIIEALRAPTVIERLEAFDRAIGRKGFGDQEIVEQLAQMAMNIARDPSVPAEEKDPFVMRAELELLRMIDEKPGDARLHIFLSNYYRNIGALPQAKEQAAIARGLSPDKPAMMIEQGVVELQMNNPAGALAFFKEAHDRVPGYVQARVLYAAMVANLEDVPKAKALLTTEEERLAFAQNDFAVGTVQQKGDLGWLAELYELRVKALPADAQNWASLAFIYYELKNNDRAIEVLKEGSIAAPGLAPNAKCIISNIETGKAPDTPCTP